MVEKTTDNIFKILKLYRSNYSAEYHVREIAKLLNKSHVTLLPHIESLKKENIVKTKNVGKNKMISLNLDNVLTKDYLTTSEIMEKIKYLEEVYIIKKIVSEIHKIKIQGTLVLFGSYSKKNFKDDSDIDILHIGSISSKDIDKIKKIGKIYGKDINIKNSTEETFEKGLRKKDALIMEILKNHVILQNHEFFIDALWRYFDETRL